MKMTDKMIEALDSDERSSKLIDHIDENDRVIGKITIGEAHDEKNPLLHRSVHVLFTDIDLRTIMMVMRKPDKAIPKPVIAPIGGHIKADDTYLQGAIERTQHKVFSGIEMPQSVYNHLVPITKGGYYKNFTNVKRGQPKNLEYSFLYLVIGYNGPFSLNEDHVIGSQWRPWRGYVEEFMAHRSNFSGSSGPVLYQFRDYANEKLNERARSKLSLNR